MSHAVDLTASETARLDAASSGPSFEELAMRRFLADPPAIRDPDYRAARRDFESANGPIVQEWWSRATPSGAALTVPRTSALKSIVAAQTGAQLHRATDEATRDFPQVAAALHEADGLAIRAGEILRGTAQRVALTHVFGAMVSLLGVVEQAWRSKQDPDTAAIASGDEDAAISSDEMARMLTEQITRAIDDFRGNLAVADSYYREAAARTTQIFYFWGMAFGVLVIAVLTAGIAFLVNFLLDTSGIPADSREFALQLAAVSAGALGACVSAMWRISSGEFYADYEAGSTHARVIGSFRPFIGAIFGLGLYFAVQAGFMPTLEDQASDFYLVAFIAFLGGFSERLAPDVFAKAEKRISSSAESERR